jgi:hypothetical protein
MSTTTDATELEASLEHEEGLYHDDVYSVTLEIPFQAALTGLFIFEQSDRQCTGEMNYSLNRALKNAVKNCTFEDTLTIEAVYHTQSWKKHLLKVLKIRSDWRSYDDEHLELWIGQLESL